MYIDLPLVTHVSLDWTDRKRKTVKLIGGKFVASVISICHIFIDCIFLFVLSAINLITYARLENDRLNKFGVNRYCVKCDIISLCLDAYCRDDLSIYEICEYMHDMIRLRYQTRCFWTLNNTHVLRNTGEWYSKHRCIVKKCLSSFCNKSKTVYFDTSRIVQKF